MSTKVWGGTNAGRGRLLVKAKTKKRALELLKVTRGRITLHVLNTYFCETGNKEELEMTAPFEEGVWLSEKSFPNLDFKKLETE